MFIGVFARSHREEIKSSYARRGALATALGCVAWRRSHLILPGQALFGV